MATSLSTCASAGLAFYGALALIVVKLIAATIAAIVAFGSVVLSPAGVAIVIEEVSVNTAMVVFVVTTVVAVLAAQSIQAVAIAGAAVDSDSFPGGHWPTARA